MRERLNPSDCEDFFNKYIYSGIHEKKTQPITNRGRDLDELEDVAIKWQAECGDYETPLSVYFDAIILHVIVETYMGTRFEVEAAQMLKEYGFTVAKGSSDEDANMNIDLKVYKDNELKFLLQVKPISFIISSNPDTKLDRINAFIKHKKRQCQISEYSI